MIRGMSTPYEDLKAISDAVYSGQRMKWGDDAIKILLANGIKPRNKDGVLKSKNFSIPKSEKDCLVLGLRYEKKDGTLTEDLFVFRKESSTIGVFYKGKLQEEMIEYEGTHKWQP